MTAVESEFQALGFSPEPGRALLEHLCDSAVFWDVDGTGFDDAGLFTDPSGAAVAIGYGKEGTYMNATVVYVPRRRVPARVWRLTDTLAQVDVIDPGQAGENQVMARFLAYLDDAPWFPRYRLSAVGRPRQARVSVGALGVDYEVHGSERSYLRARRATSGGRPVLAARGLISPWLFSLASGQADADQANSAAMVSAVCRKVGRRRNTLTGQEFWLIDADCVVPMTVALPVDDAAPAPRRGSVLSGRFVLVASGHSQER